MVDTPGPFRYEHPAALRSYQGTGTVLLVDDELVIGSLFERVLKRQGFTVLVANDGEHAVELSDGHSGPIALLLIDVGTLRGPEAARLILAKHPEAGVILMSGYSEDASGDLDVPGSTFLEKPIRPEVLLSTVIKVLEAKNR